MTWDFLAPHRLWLLAVLAGAALAYGLLQLRAPKFSARFTNLKLLDSVAPRRPGWRRHLVALVFFLGIAIMMTAYAQPIDMVRVPRERATVMLAIDTSLSMEAEDVGPNRIEAAKQAANDFLDIVPDTINVGLVSFDGAATIRVAPTTNRPALREAIDSLQLHESTAIGEAVFACLQALEQVPADETGTPPPARIILMSDGETTVGRATDAAIPAAQEAEVPVNTIAFGTEEGYIEVDLEGSGFLTPVPVPVNEEALADLAEETGGTTFVAETADELSEVYQDLGSSIGYEEEEQEVTTRYVGAALAVLLVSSSMSLIWFNRVP